jgi:ligand-binding sensor domain-containing protein
MIAGSTARAKDEQGTLPAPYLTKVWQVEDGLPQASIQAIAQDRDGYLWFATSHEGLVRFDGARFTSFGSGDPQFAPLLTQPSEITRLLGASDGGLWIGTRSSGLWRLRAGTLSRFAAVVYRKKAEVKAIHEHRGGSIWVGTAEGLVRITGGAVTSYGKDRGLADEMITAIGEDREGAVWVGTKADGLYRLRGSHFEELRPSDGGRIMGINTLLRDRQGRQWIGTDAGLYNYEGGHFAHFDHPDGQSPWAILSLNEDRYGRLWVGRLGGLDLIQLGAQGRIAGKSLSNRDGYNIFRDSEGSFWVSARDEGLMQYRD